MKHAFFVNTIAFAVSSLTTYVIYVFSLSILQYIGHAFFIYLVFSFPLRLFRLVNFIYWQNIGYKNIDWKKNGQWAVITGATDGIGKCYAQQLAEIGFDVVLISRNKEKLDKTANEIKDGYDVKTKIITMDLMKTDGYDPIKAEIESLDIGILVNNVGTFYHHPDYYTTFGGDVHTNLMNLNTLTVLEMTSICLPAMILKNRGIIINISSAAGDLPQAIQGVYPATKRFVNLFSYALRYELKDTNIMIRHIAPYFVITNLVPMKPSFWMPLAKDYVASALKMSQSSTLKSYGCLSHEIIRLICTMLPKSFVNKISFNVFNGFRKQSLMRQKKNIQS